MVEYGLYDPPPGSINESPLLSHLHRRKGVVEGSGTHQQPFGHADPHEQLELQGDRGITLLVYVPRICSTSASPSENGSASSNCGR